ncbi:glycosyltransferase [Virgibacillus sp. JSM 102003]|uniref:glycosyltransferase n=1 Tax=Virgibacillus sp. JSM 102003 TaxID=1562108 RepID=UPI0035C25627
MKKILIVNNGLSGGGIRQSLINLLEEIPFREYEVDLLLFKDSEFVENNISNNKLRVCKEPFLMNLYSTSVKDFIKRNSFVKAMLSAIIKIIVRMLGSKTTFGILLNITPKTKSYDVAISYSNDIWKEGKLTYFTGVNDYVLKCTRSKEKIAWIHSDPYKLGFSYKICQKTYEKYDFIVNVSYACKEIFDEIIPEYKKKSKVVYNMFNIDRIKKQSNIESPFTKKVFHIVTVARLSNYEKRIDRIISCCERLKREGEFQFQWHIVGDGKDRDWLKSLSKEKGLDDVIIFEGKKENPYSYMKSADVVVLSSDFESYGMVITEAFIAGTPVICTNYPAAQEIIVDERNGLLTDFTENSICDAVYRMVREDSLLIGMRDYILNNKITNKKSREQLREII